MSVNNSAITCRATRAHYPGHPLNIVWIRCPNRHFRHRTGHTDDGEPAVSGVELPLRPTEANCRSYVFDPHVESGAIVESKFAMSAGR